jgi:hypothetical protein
MHHRRMEIPSPCLGSRGPESTACWLAGRGEIGSGASLKTENSGHLASEIVRMIWLHSRLFCNFDTVDLAYSAV